MKVKKIIRKTFEIRYSGRSSDYISPSFGYGCLLNCSYCYMKRHKPEGLDVAKNVGDILTHINNHSYFIADVEKPNQTHEKYITYDIACNEDFALHAKYYNWKYIFQFFVDHPKAMATLATKIIPTQFLEFNPKKKVRIRFSLMPQKMSSIVEPNTPKIIDRIKAINTFIEAGYDVHINYSPVILYKDWLKDYEDLFKLVDTHVTYKDQVFSEVIFLTHNESKHVYNIENNLNGEQYLWIPIIQEKKYSQYGGENVRYKGYLKQNAITQFKESHNKYISWNKIRYIF
jgi:spore photoproduct lyase